MTALAAPSSTITEQPTATPAPAQLRTLRFGETVPFCYTTTRSNDRFALDSLGGRYTLLGFLPNEASKEYALMLAQMTRALAIFDPARRVVALATNAPNARSNQDLRQIDGTLLIFYDENNTLHDAFGVTGVTRFPNEQTMQAGWFLIDRNLRVLATFAPGDTAKALDTLDNLDDVLSQAADETPAPVVIVPRVFEADFCRTLLDYVDATESVAATDLQDSVPGTHAHPSDASKMRVDCRIDDESIRQAAMHRIYWRLAPQIEKAFQFKVTRMERYVVGCYDSQMGGHFHAHRDNQSLTTAHRRFAVSINLNTEEFEGGGTVFPEYSNAVYAPPTGGALIYSCTILHEILPVTLGRRYAFVPFLYDDAAAAVRKANAAARPAGVAE